MAIAKKKRVNNTLAYEFSIKKKDVIDRVHFGGFEVIKTDKGIMFKTYTGFHIFTTPYAVDVNGGLSHTTLYQWLDNLLKTHYEYEGHLDEPFGDVTLDDGTPVLKRDIYDMMKIVTEANLTYPITAFVDTDEATKMAKKLMERLVQLSESLLKAQGMGESSDDEELKALAMIRAEVQHSETMSAMLAEAQKGVADAVKE